MAVASQHLNVAYPVGGHKSHKPMVNFCCHSGVRKGPEAAMPRQHPYHSYMVLAAEQSLTKVVLKLANHPSSITVGLVGCPSMVGEQNSH